MEKITKIIQHYNIFPQAVVPITEHVHMIKSNGKHYALKESILTKEKLERWIAVYKIANDQHFFQMLPVYLTKDRQLYVQNNEKYYYLSPWINGGNIDFTEPSLKYFFKQIGEIHLKTKKYYSIKKDKLEHTFKTYKESCQTSEKELLTIIEQCERAHFPSPLQLQTLTHFKDITQALHLTQRLTDRFLSETEETAAWSTSLIHGNLQNSHIFENYLINWETSSFSHASNDLIRYFNNESARHGTVQSLLNSFPAYLKENPLINEELFYLALHLLDVQEYLEKLKFCFVTKRREISIATQTVELERLYRRVMFGIAFHEQLTTFEAPILENNDSY